MVIASRADDKLPEAVGVGSAVRVLQRKPLVIVVMTCHDNIGMGEIEVLYECGGLSLVPLLSGRKRRMMHIRRNTLVEIG